MNEKITGEKITGEAMTGNKEMRQEEAAQSQAGQEWAAPSQAEQDRAMLSQTSSSQTPQSQTGQNQAAPNQATQEKAGLNISAASFVTALGIMAVLMVLTYVLTLIIPAGSFDRVMEAGKEVILEGSYHETEGGIPFWKWLLSPILVLGSGQGVTLISVIAFLLLIGGTFNSLDRSGTMDYMLRRIVKGAAGRKYVLLAVVTLFFLSMGAFIGSFEECIPMVPLAVSLAVALGWDQMVGLGMSLAAVACGFATGVLNPFTTGVAQPLMDLPLFSGASLRILTYLAVYGCLMLFLVPYARKCEKRRNSVKEMAGSGMASESVNSGIAGSGTSGEAADGGRMCAVEKPEALLAEHVRDSKKDASMKFFVGTIAACVVSIFICAFIPALSGILMVIVALFFLVAGVGSGLLAGLKPGRLGRYFLQGMVSILPSVLLILMAGSIQFTMNEAGIMDTILNFAVSVISSMPSYAGILCIFLFAMIINFFVASGSAEAVLLMPLLGPLSDLCGISRQLTVLAYNYGDGFSNLIYFTNPCLLIALSLAGVSYGKWLKWSMKLQIMIAVCCCGILLLGAAVGY